MVSVWAPYARTMDAQVNGRRIPMNRGDEGWWSAPGEAPAGTRYGFSVNNGNPLPDPRSPWQPEGVHGLSAAVDHSAFPWTDIGFQSRPLSSALIYELHVGTFTPAGTFEGVIEKLDYLVDLGVSHIEMMPVAEFCGVRGWGYDGVDLFAPHHAYGGPDGLKKLVNAAHARGIGVVLDVIYNHFGPEGCYLEQFGPYFTGHHHTLWGKAVNFDGPQSDPVRQFVTDNVIMWLRDYHLDGLRLDDIDAILDNTALPIVEQILYEVDELEACSGRHLFVLAETNMNDPRVIRPHEMGGYGVNAQWNDEFHHAIHCALTGEHNGYYADFGRLADVAKALKQAYIMDGQYCIGRQRRHGRLVGDVTGHKFIGYLQTHDQVGNRAKGDRIGQLVSPGRQKVGAALVLTAPFIPMLFHGEEWAPSSPFQYFTDFRDADLQSAVRDGRRRQFEPFGWNPQDVPDPQDATTFERSKLLWDEIRQEPHREMLDWYKRLIRLRQSASDLSDGRMYHVETQLSEEARWLSVRRRHMSIVCNLLDRPQRVPVLGPGSTVLLASESRVSAAPGSVELPPDSVAILG